MSSWGEVVKDMLDRNEFGAKKYNKYLDLDTDEDMMQHAYEEALDLAVYLKTLIMQRQEKSLSLQLKEAFNQPYLYEA